MKIFIRTKETICFVPEKERQQRRQTFAKTMKGRVFFLLNETNSRIRDQGSFSFTRSERLCCCFFIYTWIELPSSNFRIVHIWFRLFAQPYSFEAKNVRDIKCRCHEYHIFYYWNAHEHTHIHIGWWLLVCVCIRRKLMWKSKREKVEEK